MSFVADVPLKLVVLPAASVTETATVTAPSASDEASKLVVVEPLGLAFAELEVKEPPMVTVKVSEALEPAGQAIDTEVVVALKLLMKSMAFCAPAATCADVGAVGATVSFVAAVPEPVV